MIDDAYYEGYSNQNTNSYYGQNESDSYNTGYDDSQTEENSDNNL